MDAFCMGAVPLLAASCPFRGPHSEKPGQQARCAAQGHHTHGPAMSLGKACPPPGRICLAASTHLASGASPPGQD